MKILVLIAAIAAVVIVLFISNYQATPQINTTSECNSDSECFVGGCSGQICSIDKNIMTTCEYRDYYSCYQLTSCGCVDNQCGWKVNSNFTSCLVEKGFRIR